MKKIISFHNFKDFPSFYDSLYPRLISTKYKPRNCQCKITRGDLLKQEGDILLCPVSKDFKPSNPLSHWIIEAEGKWLKKAIIESEKNGWIGSKYTKFFPCRKLKYRGIIFVSVDFYSENKEEINIERMAEAFSIAEKYNCVKLNCPENILYSTMNISEEGYDLNYYQLLRIFQKLDEKNVITNFNIDIVIRIRAFKDLYRCHMTGLMYDYSNIFNERIPYSSIIIPWYRKRICKVRNAFEINSRMAKKMFSILTQDNISHSKVQKIFSYLRKKMEDYYETGVGRGNEGFACTLLEFCSEFPWNYFFLMEELNSFYSKQKNITGIEYEYKDRLKNKAEIFEKKVY